MLGKVPEWVGDVPTWLTLIAAIVALRFGIKQVQSSREDTREATAKQIRSDYLLHAIQKPELANPDPSKLDFDKGEYGGDGEKFDDYTWFVSFMLLQCDELLRLRDGENDWDWEQIVENNINYHRDFIKSPAFDEMRSMLSPQLRRKLREMGLNKNSEE